VIGISFTAVVFLQSHQGMPSQLSLCLLIFLLVSGLVFAFTQDLIQEINELRLRVGEMDNERLQYEKKLKTTKVSEAVGKMQRWVQVSSFRTSFCFSPVFACTLQNSEHAQAQEFHGALLETQTKPRNLPNFMLWFSDPDVVFCKG